MRVPIIIAALAALLLTACGGPPAPPPAQTPAATASPTAASPTAASPTAASPTAASPTAAPPAGTAPPAGETLPAPLYILEGGQIARIERDATRRAVITAEPVPLPGAEPIVEFAASADGKLAYIVSDVESDRLVLADARGQARSIRYEQQGHELSNLVFTPDGAALLLRLLNNRAPPDLPSGLYRLPLAGGAPELLQADDPVDDPINPARTVSGYRPIAFSPDGARVLVQVFSLFYEDCGFGVMPAAGGEVTRVALPAGEAGYCGEEVWSADGDALLFIAGKGESEGGGPRLWRADAATGAAEPLAAEGSFARAPHGMAGGAVRYFIAALVRDASGAATGATFGPVELAAPGAAPTELAPPFDARLNLALWAPDGAGVALEVSDGDDERSSLRWLPIGGQPRDLPNADAAVTQMAWGSN